MKINIYAQGDLNIGERVGVKIYKGGIRISPFAIILNCLGNCAGQHVLIVRK